MPNTTFSVLDLVPVRAGHDLTDALRQAARYAATVERLGFKRYWVAEHHGMPGIGGAATSVVLAHVGQATSTIRIGAGGIMLPNHSPLQIAEQFGTLEALFPGRVDLGLGRAPGSDGRVAQAMRRHLDSDAEQFPRDVLELQSFFDGDAKHGFQATPGAGAKVPIWILGSSTFGARLAAILGLPYAFASHFAPAMMDQALATYHRDFRPSRFLDRPHVMVGFGACAADTAEEARFLVTSMQQSIVALRTGNPGKLQPPLRGYTDTLDAGAKAMLQSFQHHSAIGAQADVEAGLAAFLERTRADEVILSGAIFDPDARARSIEIVAAAAQNVGVMVRP
jgi:luciferase family oxidoreductase group 1